MTETGFWLRSIDKKGKFVHLCEESGMLLSYFFLNFVCVEKKKQKKNYRCRLKKQNRNWKIEFNTACGIFPFESLNLFTSSSLWRCKYLSHSYDLGYGDPTQSCFKHHVTSVLNFYRLLCPYRPQILHPINFKRNNLIDLLWWYFQRTGLLVLYTHRCHILSSSFPLDFTSRLVSSRPLQSDRAGNEENEDKSLQQLLFPTSVDTAQPVWMLITPLITLLRH